MRSANSIALVAIFTIFLFVTGNGLLFRIFFGSGQGTYSYGSPRYHSYEGRSERYQRLQERKKESKVGKEQTNPFATETTTPDQVE